MKKKNLEFEIVKHFGVIADKTKGWKREINSVSWNGAEPKYDIRDWSPDHEKMGKGITLSEEEMKVLYEIIGSKLVDGINMDGGMTDNSDWNIESGWQENMNILNDLIEKIDKQ